MGIVPFVLPKKRTESFLVVIDNTAVLYPHVHQHPEIQITLIKKNSGILLAGDYAGPYQEGDVFVLGADQPHVFRSNDRKGNKEVISAISIMFEEQILGSHFINLPEMRMLQVLFENCKGGLKVIDPKARKRITTAMEKMVYAKGIGRMVIFLEILEWMSDLKAREPLSQSSFQKPVNEFDNNRINAVIAYTMENSDEHISLAHVAEVAAMTPEAFCKYFKNRTQKTYIQFLNEIRIHNACKQMLKGGATISTISNAVGFNNISHFNRTFRKVIGLTPVEYINKSMEIQQAEIS